MRFIILATFAALGACTDFPDLDARLDTAARAAPFPTLQPLEPVIAKLNAASPPVQITPESETAFDSRIAQLRAKSSGLRGPVIDSATRARMRRGVAVPAAIR